MFAYVGRIHNLKDLKAYVGGFELFGAPPFDTAMGLVEADLVSWCACEYGNQLVYLHKSHLRTTL